MLSFQKIDGRHNVEVTDFSALVFDQINWLYLVYRFLNVTCLLIDLKEIIIYQINTLTSRNKQHKRLFSFKRVDLALPSGSLWNHTFMQDSLKNEISGFPAYSINYTVIMFKSVSQSLNEIKKRDYWRNQPMNTSSQMKGARWSRHFHSHQFRIQNDKRTPDYGSVYSRGSY